MWVVLPLSSSTVHRSRCRRCARNVSPVYRVNRKNISFIFFLFLCVPSSRASCVYMCRVLWCVYGVSTSFVFFVSCLAVEKLHFRQFSNATLVGHSLACNIVDCSRMSMPSSLVAGIWIYCCKRCRCCTEPFLLLWNGNWRRTRL